ncbi:hypothetical protein [Nocardioides mangrovicus]|nr:hypothetical protein [Nocardioides mangrovicus]
MSADVVMRGLRGLHPIFLSHHLTVLLVVILVIAVYMAIRQYRR